MAESRTKSDMSHARQRATVSCVNLQKFLWGDEQWTTRQRIVEIISNDPIFDKSSRPSFSSRQERYKRGLAMANRIYELRELHKWSAKETSLAFDLIDEPVPMTLHNIAFEPVVMSQGSPELIAKYGALIANRGILGCYLQTELGHGTNVSSLETTATYLPDSREFELNSPTLTSSKWWIGGLGKTSTHGVVQARLILPSGKDVGPHLFFVQLRSLKDHSMLPGITMGDIGPKAMAGYAAVDNGYARFDHLRIPRENMLSAFAGVTEDGEYIRPPHAKLSYGGMLYIRSSMVSSGGWTIAKAATIAIRYATVRRQGNKDADGLERQVITYPSVYHRLLPILADAFVFILLGRSLSNAFATMSSLLAAGDTSLLAEMHATTSGLKVLVSTTGIQDLETARRSMGGHGYSEFAGIGRMYADYLPSATYEGDNFVLDQQVVRAALKSYRHLLSLGSQSSSVLTPSTRYLRFVTAKESPSVANAPSWEDPNAAVLLLERRAAFMVKERATNDGDPDASVDQRVSKAVTEAFVAAQIDDILKTLNGRLADREASVVGKLLKLYLLITVERGLTDILSFDLIPGPTSPTLVHPQDSTRSVRMAIKQLCLELLPEAIGLTDAFGFTDWELDSALGVFDGDVYQTLWNKAQTEPLNHLQVPDGYEEYIKPMLERGQRLAARTKL